jgi:hypothetical protein
MLRDNTEQFGAELWRFLEKVGIAKPDTAAGMSFQLMKFDRLNPDVFVWLLRNDQTYIVSISDRSSDHPDNQFLADQWLGGKISATQITTLFDNQHNMYLEDGFDTIIIRQLPHDFDLDTDELYDAA